MRVLGLLASAVLLASACAAEEPADPPSPPAPDAAVPDVGEGLVVVLPPADLLAVEERDHLRRAVERAFAAALPDDVDPATVVMLEPADAAAVVDTVERAVRRVGPGGTVCVLGAGVRERIAPMLALYPATRACLLPATPVEGDAHLSADVDLDALGRSLGAAARAAARGGTVLVLDADDPMLDRRWRSGVAAAVLEPGEDPTPGRVHVVRTAEEALRMLDEQAALLEGGIVPGSPEALATIDVEDPAAGLDGEPLPPALALSPVSAVVLDASLEAALLLPVLAERDLPVVGPRSLLVADGVREDTVVLRWRVRWHLPLGVLLDVVVSGGEPAPLVDEVLVLEAGPAGRG